MLIPVFNLKKSQEYLERHPQDIHLAIAEGFRQDEGPSFDLSQSAIKQAWFKAIETEYLSPDKLEGFRTRVESAPERAGLSDGEAKQLRNKLAKSSNLADALEVLDSQIRTYLLNHFINPLKKALVMSKTQIFELMQTQVVARGTKSLTADIAFDMFFKRIQDATLNAGSQFMAMLRLIPIVYQRQNSDSKISENKFLEAVSNIGNLLERYARMNVGHLHILRDHALPDWNAALARVDKYGKGDSQLERARDYESKTTAPAYEIYFPDSFDLIDADGGLQITNNAKALERFAAKISSGEASVRQELQHAMNAPTFGCPALRIKFADGQNLVKLLSGWLTKLVQVYLLPEAKRLKEVL